MVNSTGAALDEINRYSQEVGSMMAQLSRAAKEQTEGVSQVNTAITEMDLNTQKNAALVEETTASSNAISELAVELSKRISFFTLREQQSLFAAGSDVMPTVSTSPDNTQSNEPIRSPLNPGYSVAEDDEWDEF